jgi:hypothetical protein
MENDKPSRTSGAAPVHRAVHQLLDDEPKILLDPIALRLVETPSQLCDAMLETPKNIDLRVEASKPAIKQVPDRLW